jgi:hypothetical protein
MKDGRIVARDGRLVARRRRPIQENELTRRRDELSRRIGILSALLAVALFAANAWAGAGPKPAPLQNEWSADVANLVAEAEAEDGSLLLRWE